MLADLTGFQRDLLFVLVGMETPSGSELMSEVEQSQDRPVLHGRLYSNLDDLVEEGYIEKGELDGRTNYYAITDEGTRSSRLATSGSRSISGRGRLLTPTNGHSPVTAY